MGNGESTPESKSGRIPDDAVRLQLDKTLVSRAFARSPRCGEFLRFVVEQKLAGRSYEICAESIRQRLYPTAKGHDPEACVRAAAGRLRNVLDRYYKMEGLSDEVRIAVPVSTYEPEFSYYQKPPLTIIPGARDATTARDALPQSNEAFELLCEGRRLWSERRPDRVAQAVICFDRAIQEESKVADRPYAAAYTALGDCYTFLYVTGARHSDVYHKALGAAAAGVTYAPSSADAHAALGAVRTVFERNWTAGEVEFLKALELNADCLNAHGWYSGHLSCLGRSDEAIDHARRAMAIDKVSVFTSVHSAKVLYFCRHYDEALRILLSLSDLAPANFLVCDLLGMTYAATDQFDEAIAAFQRAAQISRGSPLATAPLANVYGRVGRKREAEAIIRHLENSAKITYIPRSQIAQAWIGLGQTDLALACLDLAFDNRDFFLTVLYGWEPFDPLRGETRFRALMSKLDLPHDEPKGKTSHHVTSR